MSAPKLEMQGVTRAFGRGTDSEVSVLRGVDLRLEAGDKLAVVGPSGSGKSTLLNIAGTLERADAGTVRIDGTDVNGLKGDELAHFRNERIGFVFQLHHLLPQLTALENALVPTLAGRGRDADADEARARELLARVGLEQRVAHRPAELSGGERQRVAVVRALINRPHLLLADEPTGSLDARSAEALGELLIEQAEEEGVALLVVTHSLTLAERLGRSATLEDGVLASGAPA